MQPADSWRAKDGISFTALVTRAPLICGHGTVGVTFDRRRLDEADRFPEPVGVQTPADVTDKGMKNNSN
jgi:hypothetical protein